MENLKNIFGGYVEIMWNLHHVQFLFIYLVIGSSELILTVCALIPLCPPMVFALTVEMTDNCQARVDWYQSGTEGTDKYQAQKGLTAGRRTDIYQWQ
jgi:hypothetical protein